MTEQRTDAPPARPGPAAGPGDSGTPRSPRQRVSWSALLLVVAVAVVATVLWTALLAFRFERQGEHFDFLHWELVSVPNKWLHALAAPLRDDPSADEAIARFFALEDRGGREAARLEGAVEAAIEGRIDAVLREFHVGGRFPLPGSVFPPVDVELALAPWVLVTSPRARIERVGDDLLRPGVALEEAVELERLREASDSTVSALVLRTGGVALYPAVVSAGRTYAGTVGTAAHEWVHHYLAFYPLGVSYFRSQELRTINETVADIVGDEVAVRVLDRFGDPTIVAASAISGEVAAPAAEPAEPGAAERLRALRIAVDELLGAGRIGEAERLMAQVRDELAAEGVVIRRINQAYFAWFGSYAARADSIDPLGEELRALRVHLGSLDAFLGEVRGVTSRQQLRELLRAEGLP